MAARIAHGFFFSSSLCLKMQKLETRGWRGKWKGNGETKKMKWMKELCYRVRREGVYIGKKKKNEMMNGRKIMKVVYKIWKRWSNDEMIARHECA